MKKHLNIGSIKLPPTAATKGFGFIGKRGSGKSYGAAVFAEELFDAKLPFVVFDPIDVWWGLKVDANGKGKGLPVVVFGKEHADIQLDRTMGRKIAEAVVAHNISAVISTFGMNKTEMREIIADFSERLLQINNTPRQVLIEEAHEYVPQRVMGAGAKCFAAVEALLVMGRNRGIGVTLLNQRMATLNKDLLTQIDVLVAFRSVGPQDRKAFKDWVEVHNEENDEHFNEFMRSVPSLPTGEAWVWSPEFLEVFSRVKFRKRRTFHPDREKLGMTFKMPTIQLGDVQSFIDSFSKKPEPKVAIGKPGANGQGGKPGAVGKLTPELKDMIIKARMEGYAAGEKSGAEAMRKFKSVLYAKLLRWHGNATKVLEELGVVIESAKPEVTPILPTKSQAGGAGNRSTVLGGAGSNGPMRGTRPDVVILDELGEPRALVGKAVTMLNVLASRHPMRFTRSQLALQAGMKASGGGFRNYLAILKGNGYIAEEGDLIQATEAGVQAAGVTPEAPMTAKDLQLMWREKLTGKAREMFDVIINAHPGGMTRGDLAAQVGMEPSGGGFRNYLGAMKTNGLITIVGTEFIRASDHLFEV